jgi:tRNA pseudouridine55 synthase
MDGLLIIDKPAGPTSHDVVARVRRLLGERRIGHTGTLDPAASGVLPLVLGRATRLARFLSASDKSYDAVVRLGFATDTQDAEGVPVGSAHSGPWPALEAIERALDLFRGSFFQQPPAFSAKKIDGERSYRVALRARREMPEQGAGTAVAALPAPVRVSTNAVDLVAANGNVVTLKVDCSAGFYVRTLADDLGRALGTGAHLLTLRRVRSGDATLDDAVPLDALERAPRLAETALVPLARMLPRLSSVRLTEEGVRRAVHGCDLGPADMDRGAASADPFIRLLDPAGDLVAIATPVGASGLLHPAVVLM